MRQPQSFTTETAKPGEGSRLDAASRSDDSYEAALRAADALFSPQKDKAQPASDRFGDDLDATNGSRETAGRGRILRVLDEPSPGPTTEMMDELERERAPKRRGRKPGSKNKPKADRPTTFFPATVAIAAGPVPDPRASPAMATSADDDAEGAATAHGRPVTGEQSGHDHHSREQNDGPHAVTDDETGHVAAIPARARRRFSWVRTKLKPGQEWKRRLPKVCW